MKRRETIYCQRFLLVTTLLVFALLFGNSESLSQSIGTKITSKDIDRIIEQAITLELNLPDSAIVTLRTALAEMDKAKDSSMDADYNFGKAKLQLHLGRILAKYGRNLAEAKNYTDSSIATLNRLITTPYGSDLTDSINRNLSNCHNTLGRIAFMHGDLDAAKEQFTRAISLVNQETSKTEVAKLENNLGVINMEQSNFALALSHFQRSKHLFTQLNDSIGLAGITSNIGVVSHSIGAYEHSLEHYHKALAIYESFDDKHQIASTLINIGDLFVNSKDAARSIEIYERAQSIYAAINDTGGVATSHLCLGIAYLDLNQHRLAEKNLNQALSLYQVLGDKLGETNVLEFLGEIYREKGELKRSQAILERSIQLNSEGKRSFFVISNRLKLAETLIEQNRMSDALNLVQTSLTEAKGLGLVSLQKEAHRIASQVYKHWGQHNQSLYHFEAFFNLYDSLLSEDRTQKMAQMEALYNLSEKDRTISLLEKEHTLKDLELSKAQALTYQQRAQLLLAISILIIISLSLVFLFIRYRIKESANRILAQQFSEINYKNEEIVSQNEAINYQRKEIEQQKNLMREKNEELERFNWMLTESINYASNIQLGLMPPPTLLNSYFSDSFTIFFPKDVVSGDFYWAYAKEDTITLALADCTGHGVPGGFMSVLGITALTELLGRNIQCLDEILDNLRLLVIESLNQTGEVGQQQDGMDISLIRYTKGSNSIEFAGANHPIWIVRNCEEEPELIIHKGDAMPISYHNKMRPFSSKRIEVKPGDLLYLFSDGYRDQFGGDSGMKKFGIRRFKNILLENSPKSLDEQKNILEDTFFHWASKYDQLDDITIMGLKF